MALELDMATLAKSLKLLHSPDEDSAEQLRIIVEETIRSKYGNRKAINLSGLGLNKKSSSTDDLARAKRIKLDESTSSPLYSGTVEDSQTSDSDSDDGVALEILDDDLSCVVCRDMAVGAGNNLVECLECHSLYHQECHNPPITQDVNDPRFVWYCSNCTKNINTVGTSTTSKGSSSLGQSSKPGKIGSKNSAPSNKAFNVFSSSSKSPSSTSSSASLSMKHSTSSHSTNSKTSTIPIPKINITADKRLQIMKRNAAKKQEKRKITK